MRAMRFLGRHGEAVAQRPMQFPPTIICPVCGLRNDITVRFCRNCGLPLGAPRDPVRGTTTKRAELPSDRGTGIAAIFALLVVVGIVGVAGYFIYRGFQANSGAGTAAATARPRPSHAGGASAAPAASALVSFPAPSTAPLASQQPGASQPVASETPAETAVPAETDAPVGTDAPSARPDPTPAGRDHGIGLDLQDRGHRGSPERQMANYPNELEQRSLH